MNPPEKNENTCAAKPKFLHTNLTPAAGTPPGAPKPHFCNEKQYFDSAMRAPKTRPGRPWKNEARKKELPLERCCKNGFSYASDTRIVNIPWEKATTTKGTICRSMLFPEEY